MSSPMLGGRASAVRLRQAFDRSFAEPRQAAPPPGIDLVEITVGAEPYALRLSDITGLYVDQRITRLPGCPAALLGIAAPRGEAMPVYDLAMLLGEEPGAAQRWLAIAAARPVALAFSTLRGARAVPLSAFAARDLQADRKNYVHDLAHTDGGTWPVVDVDALIAALARLSDLQSAKN